VGFSDELFAPGTHMCLVFRDETERRRIVSRFVESGLLDGEQVGYFADTADTGEVETWLRALDVDTTALNLTRTADTYYPDGTFHPDRMCDRLRDTWTTAREHGYAACRVTGEMSWALRDVPGAERLMEYEAAINTVVKTHPVTAMCQYDANRFSGETIFEALQVHPYMVMNDQLVKNPYYILQE
ncbi:MAG: MEDS domain-containing protein, partial [Alkalispirochaeta sp.]